MITSPKKIKKETEPVKLTALSKISVLILLFCVIFGAVGIIAATSVFGIWIAFLNVTYFVVLCPVACWSFSLISEDMSRR